MKTPRPLIALALLSVSCAQDATLEPFELRFAATDGTTSVGCQTRFANQGPGADVTVGVSDVRFYVSDVRAFDSRGDELRLDWDESPFQYRSNEGFVALIDLTGADGDCGADAISFAEGTVRMNDRLTGRVSGAVARVEFRVGVPQAVMKTVLRDFSAEGAPSPLSEMHWSWAGGHRHFVFNFVVEGASGRGDGYVHLGSRDCGGDGARALTDREVCGLVNTPAVALNLDPSTESVGVDLSAFLAELDFVAPVYDPSTFEVIGEGPGVECHSAIDLQEDCTPIFRAFGLDPQTGDASAGLNAVFYAR
ncbi:MAG: MbnP family copper-binding protein [Myxococcota bacterium]